VIRQDFISRICLDKKAKAYVAACGAPMVCVIGLTIPTASLIFLQLAGASTDAAGPQYLNIQLVNMYDSLHDDLQPSTSEATYYLSSISSTPVE
jgi:hypothetical protein